ncbi:biopolymer transporter Tol [Curtobacterium sp. RRHDQ10]|uniref:TolB family protein n=1 Tax=Curtobacterium phyllosphaerae TaxID=3413379 RepID=UPI003BF3B0A2
MTDQRGRQLRPGQTSRVHVYDLEARASRVVFESASVLVEAPNVLPDGRLVLNGNGDLFLLAVPDAGTVCSEADLVPVPLDGVPEINNDHVLDPAGDTVVVSARDGDLYRVAMPGGTDTTPAVRVTDAAAAPVARKYYLHGIAPDSSSLAAIVGERSEEGVWTTDVALVDPGSGEPTFLTRDEHADDGCAFSPDGAVLLFNSERFTPGTAQLVALRLDLPDEPVRLTIDDRVNWFPHLAPDGSSLLYLSYAPGEQGHPADRPVELRLLPGALARGARMMPVPETLVTIAVGGQGTVNVPPWSPDSRWFAYCDYPLG